MMHTATIRRRLFLGQMVATSAALVSPWHSIWGLEASSSALRHAMDQAAQCCLAWLNPEQQFLPTGGYEAAHDTGRWWDAMLRYEAVTGTPIPAQAEAAMMENLRALTDNAAALLTGKLCNPHNLRETLLAYTALVRHRQSDWARAQGHKLVAVIDRLLQTDGQMDYAKLAELTGKPLTKDQLMVQQSPTGEWFNATGTTGRAIEAIVWFHEATSDTLALELAGRLAAIHLKQDINPSGQIRAELLDPAHVGHTHSYCGTLRGLLLYGLATDESKYIDAVANTYRKGLWGAAISHSGWTPHDQGKLRFSNKEGDPIGEHASAGDVAQIALWLALRAGQTDLWDDVERLIRARLLPSQKVDPQNPRHEGAWGVYSHPFGFGAILDVFAAVLHSLADFQEHVITTAPDGTVSVNLHFDIETPAVRVHSRREDAARLEITLKKTASPLRLRVPGWASRDKVQLTMAGKSMPLIWDGPFLKVSSESVVPGQALVLTHGLPVHETVETMPVSHQKFRLQWRADEVTGCQPKVPIYPAL